LKRTRGSNKKKKNTQKKKKKKKKKKKLTPDAKNPGKRSEKEGKQRGLRRSISAPQDWGRGVQDHAEVNKEIEILQDEGEAGRRHGSWKNRKWGTLRGEDGKRRERALGKQEGKPARTN